MRVSIHVARALALIGSFLGGVAACGAPNDFIGRVAGPSIDVRDIFQRAGIQATYCASGH